jgi:hypothetical protein
MGIGAVFIFVLVVVVLAVLGAGFWALQGWLKHRQRAGEPMPGEPSEDEQARPEHVAVEDEQRTRFIGTR